MDILDIARLPEWFTERFPADRQRPSQDIRSRDGLLVLKP